MKKILVTFLLFTLIFIPCACSSRDTVIPSSFDIGTEAVKNYDETSADKPDLPKNDFSAYEFHTITQNCLFQNTGFDTESENGDLLNDALYRRNMIIEDEYNIQLIEIKSDDVVTQTENAVLSGDDIYDVVFGMACRMTSLCTEGTFCNLLEIPYLDFNYAFWDQRALNELTISHKLYCTVGDIHYAGFDLIDMTLFNKKIIESYSLENPYDLVRDNKWSFDVFNKMCKAVTADLDGNGIMDNNDQWGLSTLRSVYTRFTVASGQKCFVKDNNDIPVLNMGSESFNEVYNKVLDILTKDTVFCNGKLYEEVFTDGQSLFYTAEVKALLTPSIRKCNIDYGIVPTPKLSETQDEWYSFVDTQTEMMYIPVIASDLTRTGIILEALAYYSADTLHTAYYDTSCKIKSIYDDDAADMLDIIYNSRTFDMGWIFNFSNISSDFYGMGETLSRDIASFVAARSDKVQTAIDELFKK